MKAMIFAAGLGTRLYPFTQTTSKALVKIKNITLIEIVIRQLIKFGFNEIIINVHHHADQIEEFIHDKNSFGIAIDFSDEKDQLLDTGGGLKKASWFFDDGKPFLVHNVDVISNVNLQDMIVRHIDSETLATLAVRTRPSSRYFLFDRQNFLCGWENIKTEEKIIVRPSTDLQRFAFSGIQVIDPEIFKYIKQDGKISIIDIYMKLAAHHSIKSYEHDNSLWVDAGKVESLIKAEEIIGKMQN
jgi:N-acetyl-alpha-D-muramate 1-phosphate uridylyltransferase